MYNRIALIAPFGLRARGTTRARALPLARALAARGLTVAVFIPPYDSPEDSGRHWQEDGVEVVNLRLSGTGRTSGPVKHAQLAWRLFRAARAWRPDVVHVFKPKGPSGLAGAAFWATRTRTRGESRAAPSMRGRAPWIVVDADDWEGPGGWNDDPRARYSSAMRAFFAWQERFGLAHADAWTVTSACLRERAVGLGAAAERVFILPNGLQDETPRNDAAPAPGSALRALLYTRFAGVRACHVAAIWQEVRALLPEAVLTVVGHGLASEERELAGLPGIEAVGWVEPCELPGMMARAALAIAPWDDTPANRARHSVKVLEMMAAGLPVVAYAVGELPSTLDGAGLLVPPGDAPGFARAVGSLLADPACAAWLGAMARERVASRYSWDRLSAIALHAYAAAAARPGQAAQTM